MRRYVIASHAHLAEGMRESLFLLMGERDDVSALCLFVDGNNDPASCVAALLSEFPEDDEVVVCTDLLGGSVNNQFVQVVERRAHTHLVTNVNLAFLVELLGSDEGVSLDETLRAIVSDKHVQVAYVNDALDSIGDDEDF